jgi:hypothetical protein
MKPIETANRFAGVVGAGLLMALVPGIGGLCAGTIPIPNGSFESPVTPFVSINIDAWQKSPKPDGYVEDGDFLWTQLTGLFLNTPGTSADHIDNCDGRQAFWLFAVPEVALFQDYDSVDWAHTTPTHAFDARFEVGKSYLLTAGLIGGAGNMLEGASVELSLYYRDPASNQVVVAATNIAYTRDLFPTTTHMVDFQVQAPAVQAGDPWAGQHIGVRLRSSIVDTNLVGGYWDIDNIRLNSIQSPVLRAPAWTNGHFQFRIESEPELKCEILATTDLTLALPDWTRLTTLTNFTGDTLFIAPPAGLAQHYYQARQLP